MRLRFCLTALSVVVPLFAHAEERPGVGPHQFQSTFLDHDPGSGLTVVLVVDSKTGDMWEYFSQPQNGAIAGGWGVKYLTRLKPGQKPDQLIESHFDNRR